MSLDLTDGPTRQVEPIQLINMDHIDQKVIWTADDEPSSSISWFVTHNAKPSMGFWEAA